jgi:CHASE3 domain sensor protein
VHIQLFKALKSINISDDQATEVVEAFEEYLAVKIKEANAGIEAQLKAQTWVIASIGLILAIIGLAPAFAKLFN